MVGLDLGLGFSLGGCACGFWWVFGVGGVKGLGWGGV